MNQSAAQNNSRQNLVSSIINLHSFSTIPPHFIHKNHNCWLLRRIIIRKKNPHTHHMRGIITLAAREEEKMS